MFDSITSDLGLASNEELRLPEELIINELRDKYINNVGFEHIQYRSYNLDKLFLQVENQLPHIRIIYG